MLANPMKDAKSAMWDGQQVSASRRGGGGGGPRCLAAVSLAPCPTRGEGLSRLYKSGLVCVLEISKRNYDHFVVSSSFSSRG